MSAVVFIDVEPGPRGEEVLAAVKRSAPASYVGVAGTNRVEVFFSAPSIDAEEARRALAAAIAACGEDAGSLVQVVPG